VSFQGGRSRTRVAAGRRGRKHPDLLDAARVGAEGIADAVAEGFLVVVLADGDGQAPGDWGHRRGVPVSGEVVHLAGDPGIARAEQPDVGDVFGQHEQPVQAHAEGKPAAARQPEGRKRWSNRWKGALNAFDITFDGRLSAGRK
jgi:hypothetical protein